MKNTKKNLNRKFRFSKMEGVKGGTGSNFP